jgi:DNA-directed RNA polymerase subunit RPC12/RpoP
VICEECGKPINDIIQTAEGYYCSCAFRRIGQHLVEQNTDPKKATGELKPQLQLVPQALLVEVALALKLGQKKHGPWNWRDNKVEIMTYLAAAYRHIGRVIEREDVDDRDQESGAHHLGCAAAGLGIVLDALKHGTLVDNRPPSNLKK